MRSEAVDSAAFGARPQASSRSYGTAVALSAVFGFVGVHHFYLGRHLEGILDLGLSIGWVTCFATGDVLTGAVFLLLDLAHALVVTVLLLTGNFRDGQGRIVAYPGQRLDVALTNQDMRRPS